LDILARVSTNRRKTLRWFLPLLVGTLSGLVAGGLMMQAAWEHNPQGAIHNENGIEWSYWLLIGFSWFLPVFFALAVVSYFAAWLAKLLRTRP
jgi:cell division protein FtsX